MSKNRTTLFIGIVMILAVVAAFFYFKNSQNSSSITGVLDINGVVPNGATITLSQRTDPQGVFTPFATNINAIDHAPWTYSGSVKGESYELQASLVVNGKVVTESSPMTVTAPANEVHLTLNVPSENKTANSTISGTVGINGYIPPGSTITIEGKTMDESEYTVVVENLVAKDKQFMSYTTAVGGTTYEVKGVLIDTNGNKIGESPILQVTAPAYNELLEINSSAQPPTPTVVVPSVTQQPVNGAISGTINFNGAALSNSRVVVLQKVTGTQNFAVAVDNISPQNGSQWNWTGAQVGTSYDIVAVLKQRNSNGTDTDISDSNTITVVAPAANEQLTINSGYTLPSAGGSISVSCGNYNQNGNNWSASVSFQSISGAQSYWYQIGTTNGGFDLSNFTQNATNNQNQSFNVTLNNGVTYFARYAYSNVPNLNAGSSQFSPFSQTTQLRCSQ